MNKNRIRGVVERGERSLNREAAMAKCRRRISGDHAAKDRVLTRGDLASHLKG
jgi:hypothetical protein